MTRAPALLLFVLALGAGCRGPALPAADGGRRAGVAAPVAAPDGRWTTPPPGRAMPPARVALRRAVPPPAWSVEAGAALLSSYVWRGALLVDDPVLQPAVTLARGGLSLNVWGNLDLGDANGSAGELTEVDVTLQYLHRLEDAAVPANVFGGAIWYTSPSGWFADLAELYAGVGLDVFLQPKLTVYLGVLEVEGVFGTFELGHEIPCGCGRLALGAGISAGDHHFHDALLGVPADAFGELYLDAGWAWTRGRLTVTPKVRFSSLLDGTLRDGQAHNDLLVFALHAAATF